MLKWGSAYPGLFAKFFFMCSVSIALCKVQQQCIKCSNIDHGNNTNAVLMSQLTIEMNKQLGFMHARAGH